MTRFQREFMDCVNPFRIIIVCLLIYYISTVQCQVNKCCSRDSFPTGSPEYPSFSCKTAENRTWDAYNILDRSNSNCVPDSVKIIEADESYIELNGCIDKDLNYNRLVALSCPQNTQTTSVHLMNKCCPIGKSYDHSGRFCVSDTNSHRQFENVFGSSAVVFEHRIPDCSEDEVFVEYFSMSHDIQFVGKSLRVNGTILSPPKFCIEDLVYVDSSEGVEQETHTIVRSCRPRSVCNEIPCIRRCCKTDQIIKPGPPNERCQPHPDNVNLVPTFFDVTYPLNNTQKEIKLRDYGVLHSWGCKKIMPLNPNDPDDMHYLHTDGKLYMESQSHDRDSYCIENALRANSITPRSFLCFENMEYVQPAKFMWYPYGLLISCIFLASTLIVYLSLPKLLNLHGRTLVSYLVAFLTAYILLAIIQFYQAHQPRFCYELGYLLLYCLIASFCWQTMMCVDIWLTFGSLQSSFMMRHNRNHQRKFLYYSAYAWIVPLIWVLITMWIQKIELFPNEWNPKFGIHYCFFSNHQNWKDHFLFFLVPAGIHVIVNCILFVITAINCSRVKADIHRMQCASDETTASSKRNKFIVSKAIFAMNLKLFTVMGISWVFEIISSFNKNETVETLLDLYNIFLGVAIFIIFVFKRKVLQELQTRFGFKPSHIGTATPRQLTTVTHSSNISLKDMTNTLEKNTLLLTSSSNTLQLPSVKK